MLRSWSARVRMQGYVLLLPAEAGGATRLTTLLPQVRIEVSLKVARQLAATRTAGARFATAHANWDRTCVDARRLVEQSVSEKSKAALAATAVRRAGMLYDQVAAAAKGLNVALAALEPLAAHLREIDTIGPQAGLAWGRLDHSMAGLDALLDGASRLPEAAGRLNRWKRLQQVAVLCGKHNSAASIQKVAGPAALLAIVNRYRLRLGLTPLIWNASLARAAAGHSYEMYRKRYVSHTSPTAGRTTPEDRIRSTGYSGYLSVGENVAGGFSRAAVVFTAFSKSPAHHRNLVDAAYREIGLGQAGDKWAMNFGAPLRGPWASVKPIVLSWSTSRPAD